MASPTSRSLQELKKRGYHAQVVERFNSFIKIRVDLFGCIDIVAVKGNENGVFAIQATSTDNTSKRIKKSIAIPALRAWLLAGNRFSVWGWAKRGEKGKRKLWELKEIPITLSNVEEYLYGDHKQGQVCVTCTSQE